ncbi:MAG: formate/nitrite transporter family protein [Burkholderiaceae bacterium]
MYRATIDALHQKTDARLALMRRSPAAFFVASMLAGAYVGIGILLIFTLGQEVAAEWRKLVMGASFGIALTLVVIAGAELFTGYNMTLALAAADRRTRLPAALAALALTWLGNLTGAALLVALFAAGGGGNLLGSDAALLQRVAEYKMNSTAVALLARAALCNWLVCLAVWMSARVDSDMARGLVIFWCLFAFIACGFEHSVANMTLLLAALAGAHPATVTWAGFGHNMLWVTLGNLVGGGVFVGLSYAFVTRAAEATHAASAGAKAQPSALSR